MLEEILAQPQALRCLLTCGGNFARAAASQIAAFAPEWVLIAARGSSDNAACYAQYLLGVYNQLSVALAAPSLMSLYQARPRLGHAMVIGISQSGQSPDIVAVLKEASRQHAATLAVTNDLESPLARACSVTLPIFAGTERAVAATKTYTSELVALSMLSAALENDAARFAVLDRIPDSVNLAIASAQESVQEIARYFRTVDNIVVVGRGFNYCTAREIALKIQEVCCVIAQPFSMADLMHGPVAMLDERILVILVAASGPACDEIPEFLSVLKRRGAQSIAISDMDDVLARADFGLGWPGGLPEWLTPVVAVVAGQLFAHALCLARGLDPDAPRGLSKVTRTR